MTHRIKHLYEFGPFRLDAVERLLRRDGVVIPLAPKAFDLLLTLIEQPGHLLTKDELLQTVWPDVFVEENSLAWHVSQLRKALGEGDNGQPYIETVPRRGYRFLTRVEAVNGEQEGADNLAPASITQPSPLDFSAGGLSANWLAAAPEPFELKDETLSVTAVPASAEQAETAPPVLAQRVGWRERLAWIVAGVLALALGVASLRRAPVENSATYNHLPLPEKTTSDIHGGSAISPDGRRVAMVAVSGGVSRLWIYSFDTPKPVLLAGTEGARYPFWSPDGRSIAFFAEGKLKRIEASGGVPVALYDAPQSFGGAWSSTGVILFAPEFAGSGLFQIPESGGLATPVTSPDSSRTELGHHHPRFLPDGRHFVFFAHTGQPEYRGIRVGSLDNPQTSFLLRSDSRPEYSSAGYLLFVRGRKVLAQQFDPDKLVLSGAPVPVTEQVHYDPGIRYVNLAVFGNRILLYQSGGNLNSQLVWLDRSGRQLATVGSAGEYRELQLSPDGAQVIVERTDPQVENNDLWQLDLLRETFTRLTFNPAIETTAIWAPDSSKIVFSSNQAGFYGIYQKGVGSDDKEELLLKGDERTFLITDWSSDGKFIVYRKATEKSGGDIVVLPLFGDRQPQDVLATPFNEQWGKVSPDGRWLAYRSDEAGRWDIYVQPFREPGRKVMVSQGGGSFPRWRRDGKELYYVSAEDKLVAVPVETGATFSAGAPLKLFEVDSFGRRNNRYLYDVSADGERFLVIRPLEDAATRPLTLVQNWTELLKTELLKK